MLLLNVFLFSLVSQIDADDYYELLGVSKTANTREIRKAFKNLAVTMHPDKNPDDVAAHEKFIRITRAYEVLKDDEKRKHYDIHGEDVEGSKRPQYHSYTYYRDHFGIYDDDPEIITLSRADFESLVEDSESQWFINYYSPLCSHCHDLAPTWRSLAKSLKGVIMFGAVNCEEDWALCRYQSIHSFPSLHFYPTGEVFRGERTKLELKKFILERVESSVTSVKTQTSWDEIKEKHSHWLLVLSYDNEMSEDALLLGAMLRGLLGVAQIHCHFVSCDDFKDDDSEAPPEGGSYIFLKKSHSVWIPTRIDIDEPLELSKHVLTLLPTLKELTSDDFKGLVSQLEMGSSTTPWLVYFHLGPKTDLDMDVKKLPSFLPEFSIGGVNCGRWIEVCSSVSIMSYPQFAVFKKGGGREFYHGHPTLHSIVQFARESAHAHNLRTFNSHEFSSNINKQGAWFVDFYAPWCPPCMKLLPQLRKASSSFSPDVVGFATVDCTVQEVLCREQKINAYPTTIFFNSTQHPQRLKGHSASTIVEMIQDIINPAVVSLNEETFYMTVGRKSPNEIWMIDFFMPWCVPCQQLSPTYKRLAKLMLDMPMVHMGEVNCEEEYELCAQQGIKSYPHIRLYPLHSQGLNTVSVFTSYQKDLGTLRRWLYGFIPSSTVDLTPESFERVMDSEEPWIVDFYTPWCSHCVAFDLEFITVAQMLKKEGVKAGKVNCQNHQGLCQKSQIFAYPTVLFFQPKSQSYRGVEINSQNPQYIVDYVKALLPKTKIHDEL